jgi:hypothetical protein
MRTNYLHWLFTGTSAGAPSADPNAGAVTDAKQAIFAANGQAPKRMYWRVRFVGGTTPSVTLTWWVWSPTADAWHQLTSSVTRASGLPGDVADIVVESGTADGWIVPQVTAISGTPDSVSLFARVE